MGRRRQAPIRSQRATPDGIWVTLPDPTDRSTPGHGVVHSRGQAGLGSNPMMLTVIAIAPAAHAARDSERGEARERFKRTLHLVLREEGPFLGCRAPSAARDSLCGAGRVPGARRW